MGGDEGFGRRGVGCTGGYGGGRGGGGEGGEVGGLGRGRVFGGEEEGIGFARVRVRVLGGGGEELERRHGR